MMPELSDGDLQLIEQATYAVQAYGAEPRHTVGAAIRTRDGSLFSGVNVFAQGGGACAELVVLGTAISAGHIEFDAIVAVGDGGRGVMGPCGVCRQLLLDYAPGITVIMPGPTTMTPEQLLPDGKRCWFSV